MVDVSDTLEPHDPAALDESTVFAAAFRSAPTPLLLLAVDPPRFTMVTVNEAHARAFRTEVAALEGHGVFEVFPADPDATTAAFLDNIARSLSQVLETGAEHVMPVMPYAVLSANGAALEERFWSAVNAPVRGPDGRITHIVSNVRDVTAEVNERRNEEARALLMREVDHRARNALTVVQSMIRLTEAEGLADFRAVLGGRVDALARAQTSLAERRWEGADLHGMIAQEMAALAVEGKLSTKGDHLLLAAHQVQAMSMILHELATNACKYGALSAPDGAVSVSWTRAPDGGLVFTWCEAGGPPVSPPDRTGFGSRLVARLARQLGGRVRYGWDAAGVTVELRLAI